MFSRTIKFVLIACIACWATGTAQWVHEAMEHADHGADATSLLTALGDDLQAHPHPHHHQHNHDDCPTCQLLAHMKVDRAAPPPAVVSVHLPTFAILTLNDWRRPLVDADPFAPIRGPPSLPIPSA